MASERRVVQAGYLIKSPPQEKLMAQWRRRYFILLSTKVMEYYSSHECKPQDYLKSINLSQCEDMVAPLPTPGRPYVIKLSIKTGPKLREYFLDCSNEENMSSWVISLAQTCGFCPVDAEAEDQDCALYSSADFTDQTLPGLQPAVHPSQNIAIVGSNGLVVKDNRTSRGSTLEQDWKNSYTDQFYDDMGINVTTIYAMNKNPPPVWRPKTPLLPSKVERFAEPDDDAMGTHLTRPPILPNKADRSAEPDMGTHFNRPPMVPPKKADRSAEPDNDAMGTHPLLTRSPIVPSSGSSSQSVRGLGMQMPDIFNLKNDPKFKQKLQEKRQEIYVEEGSRLLDRSTSMDGIPDFISQDYDAIDSDVLSGLDLQYNSEENPEDYLDFRSDKISISAPQTHPKTLSMKRNARNQNYKSHLQKPMPVPQREVRALSSSPVQRDVAPPPLPSRELIRHPLTVSSSQSLFTSPREELIVPPVHRTSESLPNPLYLLSFEDIPPPIPARISSNHTQSSSSNTSGSSTPVQEASGKYRAISLARHSSSPTDSQIPKRQPLLLHHHNIHQTEFNSFTDTLTHIFSSSEHQSTENSTSSGFTGREPTQRVLSTDDYDDIEVVGQVESSSMDACCNYLDPIVNILKSTNTHVQGYNSPSDQDEFYDDVVFNSAQQQTSERRLPNSPPHGWRLPDSPPHGQRLPDSPPCRRGFPDSPPCGRRLPDSPPCRRGFPESPPHGRRFLDSSPHGQRFPDSPPCGQRFPDSPPCGRSLPDFPPHGRRFPDSPTRESRSPRPPDRQDTQPNTPERRSVLLSPESHLQASLSRTNSCPPVPSAKPKIPSDKKPSSSAYHRPPPVRPKPSKPAMTEKPVVGKQTNLAKKPSSMEKPPVAQITVLIDQVSMQLKQVVMPVKKAGPPPTQPKPSKNAAIPPPITSASSSQHQQQMLSTAPPVKHKPPKPPRIPEKQLQMPLCL